MIDSKIKFARVAFAFLFGAAMLSYSFYGWYQEEIDNWQALILGLIGFVFMYIPDKLQEVVSKSIARIFNLTIGRFFGTTPSNKSEK